MKLANLLYDIGFSNSEKNRPTDRQQVDQKNTPKQTHIKCHVSQPRTTFNEVVNKQTLRYDSNKILTTSQGFIAQDTTKPN